MANEWTSRHQMLINGKSDDFLPEDLFFLSRKAELRTAKTKAIISHVVDVFSRWQEYAARADVFEDHRVRIGNELRLW